MSQWKLGDEGWEVDWCKHMPISDGCHDRDNATYIHKDFKTKDEALTYAKSVFSDDFFRSVAITPFEMVRSDPFVVKEYTSQSEYYEG